MTVAALLAAVLARDLNGVAKIDGLIALLEDSAYENQIPRLAIVKSSLMESNSAKRQLYDQILAEYGDSHDPSVRREVLTALVAKALLPGDSVARLALLDRALAMAGSVDLEAFSQSVIAAALARVGLLDDRAEIIRGYDAALDEGLRRAADFSGDLQRRLEQVLDAKIAFTDDPGLKDRYYDDIIALNPGPLPVASALFAKTRRRGPGREDKTAIFDRIISAFADSSDNRLQKIVNSAYFGKARLAADNAERIGIFDILIARSLGDSDPELRLDAAHALLAKANLANDKMEMLRAYDQIIDCYWINRMDWGDSLREIFLQRGRLAGENVTLEHYYDARIAHAVDDHKVAFVLGEKAHALPDQDAKLTVYDEIISRFRNSEDIFARREVVKARKSKLRLGVDADEELRIYKAIIADGIGAFGDGEFEVAEAYEHIIAMHDDKTEKIHLYDELLARFEKHRELQRPLSETPVLRGDGEIGGWPISIAVSGLDDWPANSIRRGMAKALLAKADLMTDSGDKIADSPEMVETILDELLTRYRFSEDYQAQFLVTSALERKLALTDDLSKMAELYAELARQLGSRGSGSFHRNALKALLNRAGVTIDRNSAIALYDEVIAKYEQTGNGFFWGAYVEASGRKAELVDDVSAKIGLYDAILDTSSGKGPPLDRGLAFPFLDEPRHVFPKYMMKKAALLADNVERARIYDQIIASYGTSNASAAVEAYDAKIDLAGDPSDKIALCDQLIAFINNSQGDSKSPYSPRLAKALRKKGEMTGNMSPLEEYYSEAIAGAAKEIDKERLTLLAINDIGAVDEKI
ncbi:MAG: hypothetical protein LBT97_14350, partial [Planctomycetota bacterium]|nr:hypothetical protein [Planctomycetota bacterium]